jgi:amidase
MGAAIEGVTMRTYVDWMATCCDQLHRLAGDQRAVRVLGRGLPVGLQLVGRRGCDLEVLRLARAFERATRWAQSRPPIVADR